MLSISRYEPSDYEAVWDLHNLALHHVGAHVGNGEWDNDLHDIDTVYFHNGVSGGHGKRSGNRYGGA